MLCINELLLMQEYLGDQVVCSDHTDIDIKFVLFFSDFEKKTEKTVEPMVK